VLAQGERLWAEWQRCYELLQIAEPLIARYQQKRNNDS
jgi:hypothetical protein